ncbi:cobaltochelatase subunit CobN [Anderseniella sp. Alg231-50]|uniref:cobaltochelatase subunit CobN n=1 Tax=Anderseniella sp. Alg231-50 TaxID=1922226 RepID=UPI000D551B62
MHLLAARPGDITDGTEPVDPDQSPADVIFISAADTELAALSQARAGLGEDAPALRLAQLGWLKHPYSVDLYLDKTATKSRLVIARLLGGRAYWTYGLDEFATRLKQAGVLFAALPGDDKPDETLRSVSTVSDEDWAALWSYMVEGGPENAGNLLRLTRHMLDGEERPPAASPLLRAGHYWPGTAQADQQTVAANWVAEAPVATIVFYRALVQGGGLDPVDRMIEALQARGLNPNPVFVASLKDPVSAATLGGILDASPPDVVINATSFAVSSPDPGNWRDERVATVLDAPGVPVLQAVLAAHSHEAWADGTTGLTARDIAMNVALPEVDGRLLSRAISFKDEDYRDEACECAIATHRALPDRVEFVADMAARWARLKNKPAADRKVAIILANYPNKDGRLANGVGLDTPQGTITVLSALKAAGYLVDGEPETSDELMQAILAGPTNWLTDRAQRNGGERLSPETYQAHYTLLPEDVRNRIESRWGKPEDDPFFGDGGFALAIHRFGHVAIGVQPARGYNIDPEETYHSPDLVPPHNYLAFYFWLRGETFDSDVMVHMGKHGNLEWLPGKATALSQSCLPEAVLGPVPNLYPFIVNDPGEGTQAKRRTQAVIIDHLTPPLTRAETYGPLRDLEALVDEYYEAAGVDPRRIGYLRDEILSLTQVTGLDVDAGMADSDDSDARLQKLDTYLCELKESQIRDGLHVFGAAPDGRLETDLVIALTRIPRGDGSGGNASLIRALATDLELQDGFDPLDSEMGSSWTGKQPDVLAALSTDTWRTAGDTVERLELLAAQLVSGGMELPAGMPATKDVLDEIDDRIRPAVRACGTRELGGLLTGLNGSFVPPGPSGAPTRGRLDVLPTGRNFFSMDARALPTRAAWELGRKSADLLVERHVQDHGDWPRAMAVTAWGTANMRTGGDDIAQALALMGVKPKWDSASTRVTGFEVMPLAQLGRPRVDVTLRVSGFFRDAFPAQLELVDSAARAVMTLSDEAADDNPASIRYHQECKAQTASGASQSDAALKAGARVFGSKPGAYGAGLQAMIDEKLWAERADLGDAYLEWGGYAYGQNAGGRAAHEEFATRLSRVEAVVQNQDNREHDVLDSDDYYQFEGGMSAAVEKLSGQAPAIYHNDHSRPERPVVRTLDEEIGRVVRSRAVNPKWIEGVKRHGYKGAFEMAATVDYLFAFAATTGAVRPHHFDLVHEAYLEDDATREFIEAHNPAALREIAQRLSEAMERGMWTPKSNSARGLIEQLQSGEQR